MRHLPLALLVALVSSGCDDAGKDDTGSGSPDAAALGMLTDPNNFSFTGALDAPRIATASGVDVTVCWDEVVHDLQCHDLDPVAGIDNLGVVRFPNYTEEEAEAALSQNDLPQSAISGYVEHNTDGVNTCANLSEFSFFGTAFDIETEYTQAGGLYMLLLTEGTTVGVGARMIAFLAPSEAELTTEVSVPDGCGLLDIDADLESLTPAPIPEAAVPDYDAGTVTEPYTVDWSTLTIDGQGNPIAVEDIDGLMIAFYEGQTPASLETQLLDLESIATELYTMPLSGGTSADLTLATGTTGAFTGFSGDGTWLLALRCSRCYNPAPVFLTVVEPS